MRYFNQIMENIMATFKTALIVLSTAIPALTFSLSSQAAMDAKIEAALIEVCKSVTTNKVYNYQKTAKSYQLKDKTVALKVVCNDQDIISFAESHGADKTAAKLQKSLGDVNIIDIAATNKLRVTFKE